MTIIVPLVEKYRVNGFIIGNLYCIIEVHLSLETGCTMNRIRTRTPKMLISYYSLFKCRDKVSGNCTTDKKKKKKLFFYVITGFSILTFVIDICGMKVKNAYIT